MAQAVRFWTVSIGHGAETLHEIITYDYVFQHIRGFRARGHQALVVRVPEPQKTYEPPTEMLLIDYYEMHRPSLYGIQS